MDRKTAESRQNYNKQAANYDQTAEGRFTMPFNKMILEQAVLRDGDTILDAACGNGRLLGMLAQKAKIQGFGIDISEEMINAAAERNGEMNFQVCSAMQTPFADHQFELVTVCCAFHHFTQPAAFMAEARRILKPDGKLIIAEPTLPTILRMAENLLLPLFKMGDVKIYSQKELADFYTKAGFQQITFRQQEMRLLAEGTAR